MTDPGPLFRQHDAPPREHVRLQRHAITEQPWLLKALLDEVQPRQHHATFGRGGGAKTVPVPRLEAWLGDLGTPVYSFGGRAYAAERMGPVVNGVRLRVEHELGERFTTCFVNVYRDGRDHIPWHSDDDAWIGPTIASVSFGYGRVFQVRDKLTGEVVFEDVLYGGDLLVMRDCQRTHEHRVLREPPHPRGRRLNLTFRQVLEVGRGHDRV